MSLHHYRTIGVTLDIGATDEDMDKVRRYVKRVFPEDFENGTLNDQTSDDEILMVFLESHFEYLMLNVVVPGLAREGGGPSVG